MHLNNRDQIPKFKIRPKMGFNERKDEEILMSPTPDLIQAPLVSSAKSSLMATAKFGGEQPVQMIETSPQTV